MNTFSYCIYSLPLVQKHSILSHYPIAKSEFLSMAFMLLSNLLQSSHFLWHRPCSPCKLWNSLFSKHIFHLLPSGPGLMPSTEIPSAFLSTSLISTHPSRILSSPWLHPFSLMQRFLIIHSTHLVLNICNLAFVDLLFLCVAICFPKVITHRGKGNELAFTEHLLCDLSTLYLISVCPHYAIK